MEKTRIKPWIIILLIAILAVIVVLIIKNYEGIVSITDATLI